MKNFTFLLLMTALLGTNFMSVNLGVRLSLYRLLLLMSPILLVYIQKNRINIKRTMYGSYVKFLVFWAIYSILLLVFVKDFEGFVRNYFFLLCALLSSFFIASLKTIKDYIKAYKIIELFAFAFSMLGLYEIYTGNYMFISQDNLIYYDGRSAIFSTLGIRVPISVFANPNNYALFLLVSIFISYALVFLKDNYIDKIFSVISCLFFIFMLMATQSRSCFISFLLGIVFLLYRNYKASSFKVKCVLVITLLVSCTSIFAWLVKNMDLYLSLITVDLSSSAEGSDMTRMNLIKNGLIFIVRYLFLGVGLGNIEYHMAHNAVYYTSHIMNIHNWWMEILVSSGILVFIWYCVLYYKNFKNFRLSINKFDHKSHEYYLAISGICIMIAFIIGSMGSSSLFNAEWLWMVFNIIFGLSSLLHDRRLLMLKQI